MKKDIVVGEREFRVKMLAKELTSEEILNRDWKDVIYPKKNGEDEYYPDYIMSLKDNEVKIIRVTWKGGSCQIGKVLNIRKTPNDYTKIGLSPPDTRICRTLRLHRLMWRVYKGPIPKDWEINHKDGNKENYKDFSKMECTTRKKNITHAFKIGLMENKGCKNDCGKFSEKFVDKIRLLAYKKKRSCLYIARYLGISPDRIYNVVRGRSYNKFKLTREEFINYYVNLYPL